MAIRFRTLAFAALLASSVAAHATPLVNRGFEFGSLNGWQYDGDVSAQTADLGVTPTRGEYAALLTTGISPPTGYSPFSADGNLTFLVWLGLPTPTNPIQPDWLAFSDWREATGNQVVEGNGNSGIRQSIELRTGDVLSYDWDRVGDQADGAFALFYSTSGPFWGGTYVGLDAPYAHLSNMDLAAVDPLCARALPPACTLETGWQQSRFVAPSDGSYTVAFGVFNRADDGYASALWLDNFKVSHQVPEPGTLGLVALGIAGLAVSRRRKTA